MMTVNPPQGDRPYAVMRVQGKLTEQDYEATMPQLEEAIRRAGKLRLLITLSDFHGWTPSALMDDLKFDMRHRKDFDRMAIVGEKTWQKLGTKISAPFFGGEVRWFDQEEPARDWLEEIGARP